MQGCQVANARRSQVWAEALDAWLQQLAQEIVHEHTSQALTPANVQASLQLLLAKGVRVAHQGRNSKCHAARLDNAYQAALTVRSSVNINCTPLHTAGDIPEVWYTGHGYLWLLSLKQLLLQDTS
ncbi:hypothetical protein ABBQ38_006392 [Trebouxia sp. C0009 RCD-2024]